jgi:hypothetical protein
MEIDPEELKKLVRMWFAQLRRTEAELLAYASALEVLLHDAPADKQRLLDTARQFPKIAEVLKEKYEAFEREVLENIDKGSLSQDLLRRLQEWKPEGSVN